MRGLLREAPAALGLAAILLTVGLMLAWSDQVDQAVIVWRREWP